MAVSGNGFPKTCRLQKPSDFRNVFSSSHRSVDSQFLILACRNNLDHARLGLAISKRKIQTAVGRNRVKRVIRESFRRNRAVLAGLDIVVVSQKRIAPGDNGRLFESLGRHWEKIGK